MTAALPGWLREDGAAVSRLLDVRANGDQVAWRLWDGVLLFALSLDTLAAWPSKQADEVPKAWSTAMWLSERLPEPGDVLSIAPSLLDLAESRAAALLTVANVLVEAFTAPAGADPGALLARVAGAVVAVSMLLAQWDARVPAPREPIPAPSARTT